jgi:effector protein HopM1
LPKSIIPRPAPSTLAAESVPTPARPARLVKVFEGLSLHAPLFPELEQKLKLASEADGAQSTELQSKIFAEHMQQLTEHLALLHIDHEEDVLNNPPLGDAGNQELAASRRTLAEYANSSSAAISDNLNTLIITLEDKVTRLKKPESDTVQAAICALKKVFKQASTLLDTVLQHANLNTVIEDLNRDHRPLGLTGWVGPIAAAAIPQFVASMTHLGYVRAATGDAVQSRFPEDAAFLTRSAIIGAVTGIAHEGINAVVKPACQALFHATSLADQANMVGLRAVEASSLIPEPLPFKTVNGHLESKSGADLIQESHQVKVQRTRLADKQAMGTSTNALAEAVPYLSFGTIQAVLQLANDLTEINGMTLAARSLASGAGGALSAGVQTAIQLGTTFSDDKGRTFPAFVPDRKPKPISALVKGVDVREPNVRTAFYSKGISGIQSAIFNGSLPSATQPAVIKGNQTSSSPLGTSQIVKNALLAAVAPLIYLSTLFPNQAIDGETRARHAAQPLTPGIFDRSETAMQNVLRPGRPDLPHISSPTALNGSVRAVENVAHMGRGMLQTPPQVLVDIAKALDTGAVKGIGDLFSAVVSRIRPSTAATDGPIPMPVLSSARMNEETQSLRAAEEGRAGPSVPSVTSG